MKLKTPLSIKDNYTIIDANRDEIAITQLDMPCGNDRQNAFDLVKCANSYENIVSVLEQVARNETIKEFRPDICDRAKRCLEELK